MLSPVITENSGGIPLHAYLSSIQTGGGGAPYMQMISKNMVVPIGLSVINQVSDSIFDVDVDLVSLKEIPDSLFDQCLNRVSAHQTKKQNTKKRQGNKKKRVSKRSWF